MLKQILAHDYLRLWPTVGTVIFVGFAALIGLWLCRPGARERYLTISRNILSNDEEGSHDAS